MKHSVILMFTSLAILLAGCGGERETSSTGAGGTLSRAENTITTNSGEVFSVVYDRKVRIGDVARVKYSLKKSTGDDQVGTLHWGDNSTDRMAGSGIARHTYKQKGTYRFAIHSDGGEKTFAGSITVLAPLKDAPDDSVGIPEEPAIAATMTTNVDDSPSIGDSNQPTSSEGLESIEFTGIATVIELGGRLPGTPFIEPTELETGDNRDFIWVVTCAGEIIIQTDVNEELVISGPITCDGDLEIKKVYLQ